MVIPCSDAPEVARIEGPSTAPPGSLVVLDGSRSDAGTGDEAENNGLSFQWSVEGATEVRGRTDEPTVSFITPDNGEVIVRLEINDGSCSNPGSTQQSVRVALPEANWLSYDTNTDGLLNISDPVSHLNFLFLGGATPQCRETTDFNRDGVENITDPVAALNHLFLGGAAPAAGLGCQSFPSCGLAGVCR
jgi:hypothetical protein